MEKTSIIILAYKEPEKFKRMFETLLRNTDKSITPFEIIIVDNGSEEKMKDYLKEQEGKIDYLVNLSENRGVTKGYNLAVSYSKGHYLCFFNSDYYMMKGWLKSMIDCFEHQVFASSRSYGEWLLDQGIIYNIITDNDIEENTAYIYATKSGIPLIKTIEGIHVIPNDSIIKITNIMDAW